MMLHKKPVLLLLPIALVIFIVFWVSNRPEKISYNRDIRPIVNNKCISCHGGVKQSGGFSLLFEEEAKRPSESGKLAIVPGDSRNSEIIKRLNHSDTSLRMPLDKEPLTKEEIQLISDWIDQGAEWEEHWAYIPPDPDITPPQTVYSDLTENEIDRFIFAKLEEMGLAPSAKAEKELLLRRLHLDLTGLPPSKQDYENFLADQDPGAYEKAVDRLLSSSAFGEKWASMWLDLARYADSKGYEKDLHREIWKYRDWVIQAFNKDMSFEQFTIEQLAGDLLPNASVSQLIATAFHRNTMANDEGGTHDEEFRVAAVLERVATTFEVWQGTTMACVQCHSHTYDPIRHEEFYQVMAIFNNTADKDLYNEQPKLVTYAEEDKPKIEAVIDYLQTVAPSVPVEAGDGFLYDKAENLLNSLDYRKVSAAEFQDKSSFIELVAHDQKSIWQVQDSSWIMFEAVDLTDVQALSFGYASLYGAILEIRLDEPLGPKIGEVKLGVTAKGFPGNKPEQWRTVKAPIQEVEGKRNLFIYFRKDRHYTQDLLRLDWIFYHQKNPKYLALGHQFTQKLKLLEQVSPEETPILRELDGDKARKTHFFNRGDWRNPGEEVKPGVPASFGKLEGEKIDRLDFAKWLFSKENPLTARVFVNRVWDQIFGFGIVETLEDFGSQGIPPTHPELLDWLAVQFRDKHKWHIKPLIKQIVLSAAYQQSTAVTAEALDKDPYNKFLSRGARTRLPAEMIRDQVLAISGLLNLTMYGPSVMPYQPESITSFNGAFWTESKGEDRYRRALYTYWKRTNSYPSMVAFDSPSREICTSQRVRTNTPLQALTLLNDPAYVEAAEALAQRIWTQYPGEAEEGIREYLQLVTGIPPQEEKTEALLDLYKETVSYYRESKEGQELLNEEQPELAALSLVANVMFNLDEFVTRR
jgi:hypothetical protein